GKKNPDTDLHTIAHEYTHLITHRTAGLLYEFESGALNESIGDIMALAIADHLDLPGPKWEFDHLHHDNGLRNFRDPNLKKNPYMVGGKFWKRRTKGMKPTKANDYGGVHNNSSVVNHWCFLLAEGAKGVNEKGMVYAIDAVDFQDIAKILYRALALYLGPTSDFEHARIATIIAAEDFYGQCAKEVAAVANAWYAVGVGEPHTRCDDTWLSFYSIPNNGASVSIYLDEEMEVTVVENDYKITKVINYPKGGRPARWVVSNKTDGSVVRSSIPLPYVGMIQRSEEETFKQLGVALGKVSPTADTAYTAAHFDRDFLIPRSPLDDSGSYVRPDGIIVNRYKHPLLDDTEFWSAPQIKVPLLAHNWAVRFGMVDPKLNPGDNIFRGFLLGMKGPKVNFYLEPHEYRREINGPLFSDAAVFRAE
ncbi:MAG: M4 family metallopeptidase, partial [Bacteroidota bacterium]